MRITIPRFFLALSLLIPASAFALPYSALYIFGDSLSDSGNVATITNGAQPGPGTAYTQRRFTNEFNYADGLAAQLGLSATPSLLGGTNFAFGGARTNNHPDLGPAFGVLGQVGTFIGQPGSADASALYVVLGGTTTCGMHLSPSTPPTLQQQPASSTAPQTTSPLPLTHFITKARATFWWAIALTWHGCQRSTT